MVREVSKRCKVGEVEWCIRCRSSRVGVSQKGTKGVVVGGVVTE
jgi:hypothetical protein